MEYNMSDIARRTGLSRAAVSKILNKKQKNPRLKSLQQISKALNCSVDELLKEMS